MGFLMLDAMDSKTQRPLADVWAKAFINIAASGQEGFPG
jgi:hypothetical protein